MAMGYVPQRLMFADRCPACRQTRTKGLGRTTSYTGNNCVRSGDEIQAWRDFLNTGRLARGAWCTGLTFRTPSTAPKAIVGIVHRDLKPGNIKAADGTVKVLDFGLAKAMEPVTADLESASGMRTVTSPAVTQAGVIFGTAAYMSPEQARGRRVDKRTDIWAFGCLLFEMLTGRRAFMGENVSETLASVLKSEPDWAALPATTPPTIRSLLRRCLQRDPEQRLRDISDARFQIEDALNEQAAAAAPALPGSVGSRLLWASGGAGIALAAAAAATWYDRERDHQRVGSSV